MDQRHAYSDKKLPLSLLRTRKHSKAHAYEAFRCPEPEREPEHMTRFLDGRASLTTQDLILIRNTNI